MTSLIFLFSLRTNFLVWGSMRRDLRLSAVRPFSYFFRNKEEGPSAILKGGDMMTVVMCILSSHPLYP